MPLLNRGNPWLDGIKGVPDAILSFVWGHRRFDHVDFRDRGFWHGCLIARLFGALTGLFDALTGLFGALMGLFGALAGLFVFPRWLTPPGRQVLRPKPLFWPQMMSKQHAWAHRSMRARVRSISFPHAVLLTRVPRPAHGSHQKTDRSRFRPYAGPKNSGFCMKMSY